MAEHDYRIFAMTETLTCYGCGAHGHTKYHCPDGERTFVAGAGAGAGPPVTAAAGSPLPPKAVLVDSVRVT